MLCARMLPVAAQAPDPAVVEEAVRVLRAGGLVVLPTETVYGVAADPRQPAALQRLFQAKGRDDGKPVARLAASAAQVAAQGIELSGLAGRLAARFWPGPLTMVLEGPEGPVGYRVPDHAVPLAVLRAFGAPIAATSANRSGQPDAVNAAEAAEALGTAVDLILDAGPAPGAVPSTVVRIARGKRFEILRAGALAAAIAELACAEGLEY